MGRDGKLGMGCGTIKEKNILNQITNYIHKEVFALRKVLLTWFLILMLFDFFFIPNCRLLQRESLSSSKERLSAVATVQTSSYVVSLQGFEQVFLFFVNFIKKERRKVFYVIFRRFCVCFLTKSIFFCFFFPNIEEKGSN